MAVRDIKSASVSSDGWSLFITLDTMGVGGVYASGIGANNDPTNAKFRITSTSEGYNDSGVLGTIERSFIGTEDINVGAVRLPDPNETSPDETVSGSDVIIRVPVSERIWDDDVDILIDIDSGWYTESGNPNNAVVGFAVTNNSTLDYPRVVGNFGDMNLEVVEGPFKIEFNAFSKFARDGKQLACVKIIATDEHANSVNYTLTDMSLSERDDALKVISYVPEVETSSMISGDEITIEAFGYPWVGDADSTLNTNDGVNAFPSPLYTNLKKVLYKNGEFGHCVVDTTNGNDGSASIYATQILAESAYSSSVTNAYLTFNAAFTALQAYHNTTYSRNHASGGFVYLPDGTHLLDTTNGGIMTHWATITKLSTASKANVHVQAPIANSKTPEYCKIKGVTVDGGFYWRFQDVRSLWIDDCIGGTTSGTTSFYGMLYGGITNCTGHFSNGIGLEPFSTNKFNLGLIRGNDFDVLHSCRGWTILGNRNVSWLERGNAGIPPQDGGIMAFFDNTGVDDIQVKLASDSVAGDNLVHGIALIQGVFERIGTQTAPMGKISGDSTVSTTNNVIIQYVTVAGARFNVGYNDLVSPAVAALQTNWSVRNDIFSSYNNKDDVFGNNPLAVGGWSIGYAVGHMSNFYRSAGGTDWLGEFQGLWMFNGTPTVPRDPKYINDASADGTNLGGGDYHLDPSSECYSLSKVVQLPYDLEGNARVINGSVGAYEMNVAPSPVAPYSKPSKGVYNINDYHNGFQNNTQKLIGDGEDKNDNLIYFITSIEGKNITLKDSNSVSLFTVSNFNFSHPIRLEGGFEASGTNSVINYYIMPKIG